MSPFMAYQYENSDAQVAKSLGILVLAHCTFGLSRLIFYLTPWLLDWHFNQTLIIPCFVEVNRRAGDLLTSFRFSEVVAGNVIPVSRTLSHLPNFSFNFLSSKRSFTLLGHSVMRWTLTYLIRIN